MHMYEYSTVNYSLCILMVFDNQHFDYCYYADTVATNY